MARSRRPRALRDHAIAGVFTFAILQVLFAMLLALFGCRGALALSSLLRIVIISVIIGAPIGYLIGRDGGGMGRGALIGGAALVAVSFFFLLVLQALGAPVTLSMALSLLVATAFLGMFAGALIGLHVQASH